MWKSHYADGSWDTTNTSLRKAEDCAVFHNANCYCRGLIVIWNGPNAVEQQADSGHDQTNNEAKWPITEIGGAVEGEFQ